MHIILKCNKYTPKTRVQAKGSEEMESKKQWRTSIVLTEEQENAILSIRQRYEYRRCSLAEIMRMVIEAGLKQYESEKSA